MAKRLAMMKGMTGNEPLPNVIRQLLRKSRNVSRLSHLIVKHLDVLIK